MGPTGWGIQLDMGLGLSNDCKSTEDEKDDGFPFDLGRRLQGGKFNPACTTDTSKCGTGPSPTPPSPPSPPTPPSPTPPSPPSPPPPPSPSGGCSSCPTGVHDLCPPWQVGFGPGCMNCVFDNAPKFIEGGCNPPTCQRALQQDCAPP